MPFVLLRVNEEVEAVLFEELVMRQARELIARIIPGDLDPDDDLDVNIEVRHPAAHSKYSITIDIEMMHTPERAEELERITQAIHGHMNILFGSANVWIKLVEAGYAPTD